MRADCDSNCKQGTEHDRHHDSRHLVSEDIQRVSSERSEHVEIVAVDPDAASDPFRSDDEASEKETAPNTPSAIESAQGEVRLRNHGVECVIGRDHTGGQKMLYFVLDSRDGRIRRAPGSRR